ncbi:hypothetical protein B0T14DRAFT_490644 [Immersiella caudata]|uniref:Uncharacterized protein n=1 Tax=Immersiella caudata TaxID=314043 RepID=A0AA39XE28_9PEZI|nr:hypothetical protein B0T14DRAFT_490644 [Immersiella caudata]
MKLSISLTASLAVLASASPQTRCRRASSYSCTPNHRGWQVCSTAHQWAYAGACSTGQICRYYGPSGSPDCVGPNAAWPPAKIWQPPRQIMTSKVDRGGARVGVRVNE